MGKRWGSAAGRLGWDIAPCAEVIPEADAKLADLGEPKEDVARVATEIAAGPSAAWITWMTPPRATTPGLAAVPGNAHFTTFLGARAGAFADYSSGRYRRP
jgi:hypothetical protein